MARIPRLNQNCDIYTITNDYRGDRTKTMICAALPCRFSNSSNVINNAEGEYVEYSAYAHVGPEPIIQKGYFIRINNKDYIVDHADHTKDLAGNTLMQFLKLNEAYAD